MSAQSNYMARLSPKMYFYMGVLYEKFFIRKNPNFELCVGYFSSINILFTSNSFFIRTWPNKNIKALKLQKIRT